MFPLPSYAHFLLINELQDCEQSQLMFERLSVQFMNLEVSYLGLCSKLGLESKQNVSLRSDS